MELGHAYSVLVVSASAKFNESVRGLLPERFYWPVTVLTDAAGHKNVFRHTSSSENFTFCLRSPALAVSFVS